MKSPTPPAIKFKQQKVVDQQHCVATASVFRRQSLVTATELADKIGLDKSHLSLLESGKRNWTEEIFTKYIKGVSDLVAARAGK